MGAAHTSDARLIRSWISKPASVIALFAMLLAIFVPRSVAFADPDPHEPYELQECERWVEGKKPYWQHYSWTPEGPPHSGPSGPPSEHPGEWQANNDGDVHGRGEPGMYQQGEGHGSWFYLEWVEGTVETDPDCESGDSDDDGNNGNNHAHTDMKFTACVEGDTVALTHRVGNPDGKTVLSEEATMTVGGKEFTTSEGVEVGTERHYTVEFQYDGPATYTNFKLELSSSPGSTSSTSMSVGGGNSSNINGFIFDGGAFSYTCISPEPEAPGDVRLNLQKIICTDFESIRGNRPGDAGDHDDTDGMFEQWGSHYTVEHNLPVQKTTVPETCRPGDSWKFTYSFNNNDLDQLINGETDSEGLLSVNASDLLDEEELAQFLAGEAYLAVGEVLDDDFQFGALQCHNDARHANNREWVELDADNLPEDVWCVAWNVEEPQPQVELNFKKIVCDEFGVIPANSLEGDGTVTYYESRGDITDATGGQFVNWSEIPTVTPIDPTDLDYHYPEGCSPAEGWTFELSFDQNFDAPVFAVGPTPGAVGSSPFSAPWDFTSTITDLDLANEFSTEDIDEWLSGDKALWVREVEQDGFQFGALQCHNDALHPDNLEQIRLSTADESVWCLAYNVLEDNDPGDDDPGDSNGSGTPPGTTPPPPGTDQDDDPSNGDDGAEGEDPQEEPETEVGGIVIEQEDEGDEPDETAETTDEDDVEVLGVSQERSRGEQLPVTGSDALLLALIGLATIGLGTAALTGRPGSDGS